MSLPSLLTHYAPHTPRSQNPTNPVDIADQYVTVAGSK